MRLSRFLAISIVSLALVGCAPLAAVMGGIPPAPAAAADRTMIDEQTALSVELAYQAATVAIGAAVNIGVLRGEGAERVAVIDRRAYRAVLATRAAYDAGNATSYGAAATTARTEIAALLALLN